MRLFFSALMMCVALASPARAEEPAAVNPNECALSLDAIKPVMTVPPDLKPSYTAALDPKTRLVRESVTLDNGMKISYSVGGCEHYAFSYIFENIPMSLTLGREPFELAVELLRQVPGLKDNKFEQIFQTAIDEQIELDDAGGFDCGEAYCIMRREGNRVDLDYDYAL
jgi:hypothetical protein